MEPKGTPASSTLPVLLCQEAIKHREVFLHETHFVLIFVCFLNESQLED